jgi:hypothetical protein
MENGKSIARWKGVFTEGDKVVIPLGSGDYSFELKNL